MSQTQTQPKTLVYSDPNCPVCKTVAKTLKPAVKAGKVTIVKDGSKKAKQILEQVKIRYVPECIQEGPDGKFTRCNIETLVKKAEKGEL
jgi:glutaredoxin